MIETPAEIDKATSVWWRWLLWLPRSRRVARELLSEVNAANGFRQEKVALEGKIQLGQSEISTLQQENDRHRKALIHLIHWIQTTHRVTPMPEPKTIKRLLYEAQNTSR